MIDGRARFQVVFAERCAVYRIKTYGNFCGHVIYDYYGIIMNFVKFQNLYTNLENIQYDHETN